MWGVSDPLCHPPEAVPDPLQRGSLTPHLVRTKVTARRAKRESRLSWNGGRFDNHRLLTRCVLLQETFCCPRT